MQSNAATVEAHLAELPEDRRDAIQAVRDVIRANLDQDYEEGMQYGMIGYYVPHSIYPAGYHCDPRQPVPYVNLASQKNYMSLYMSVVYGDNELAEWFQAEWKKTGKKLDMGKCCIRFKKVEDLALNVIGEAIRRVPAAKYIEIYEAAIKTSGKPCKAPSKKSAKPFAAGKASAKTVKAPPTKVSKTKSARGKTDG